MTTKQYRTAQGKLVDMGALMLQNEGVRAVGNMSVNARGDRVDSNNQIIDRKTRQAQRQYQKQTNVSNERPTPNSGQADAQFVAEEFPDLPDDNDVVKDDVNQTDTGMELQGGLAAAIAKAKTVQQTKLPTQRETARAAGVRKI